MNGWIVIDKPKGATSHDVVNYIRRVLKIKHVGHSGTLDPIATGVLVIATGKATKLIQFLPSDKHYMAEIYLGIRTDTMDADGQIISKSNKVVSKQEFSDVLLNFTGKIKQTPPMFSACHFEGKRMYELARKGIQIENLPSREVQIYNIDLINFQFPLCKLKIECSKGTYIRVLAEDIGEILGCGAYLYSLQRIMANNFTIDNAIQINLADFKDCSISDRILPMDFLIKSIEYVCLSITDEKKFQCGQYINYELQIMNYESKKIVRVYNSDNNFIGMGEITDKMLKPVKVFIDCPSYLEALKSPESRKSQVWSADPLFKEVIKFLKND